jgi:hypothetical protein
MSSGNSTYDALFASACMLAKEGGTSGDWLHRDDSFQIGVGLGDVSEGSAVVVKLFNATEQLFETWRRICKAAAEPGPNHFGHTSRSSGEYRLWVIPKK